VQFILQSARDLRINLLRSVVIKLYRGLLIYRLGHKNRGHFVLWPITLEILNRSLPNLAESKSLHSEHRVSIYLNQLWKIVAPSGDWQWHFYNYEFWIGYHFLTSFQITCLHCYFIFINYWRKNWPQLLISYSEEKHQRHKSDNASANIPDAVLRCPSLCCAWAIRRSRFHSTRRKVRHHVTWCLAKTSYPTSRWDVAVTNGHCSRTVLPRTPPETQKLAAWEPAVHWVKLFVHRIARIWTRLTCNLVCSSADGLPMSKFLLSWQNEESDCQKHDRNYRMAQSMPIHHFYHLFIYGQCYSPDGATIFQGWFK